MSHFDNAAGTWDENPIHWDRSKAIAREIENTIPFKPGMKALEYGAGTAILSFLLSERFSEITLMDSSAEMVKVMNQKVSKSGLKHLTPLLFDLEHNDYSDNKFDIVYSQMVLHHVENIDLIFRQFAKIINPGGYLVIADLYSEDGTFHDYTFTGHKGFDPEELALKLKKYAFSNIKFNQCYVIKRESSNGTVKEFPVFLLSSVK